jgi:hypothetical protein
VVCDLWRGLDVRIVSPVPVDVWYVPVESLSRSESGWERVYQGTALYFSRVCTDGGEVSVELTVELAGRGR